MVDSGGYTALGAKPKKDKEINAKRKRVQVSMVYIVGRIGGTQYLSSPGISRY